MMIFTRTGQGMRQKRLNENQDARTACILALRFSRKLSLLLDLNPKCLTAWKSLPCKNVAASQLATNDSTTRAPTGTAQFHFAWELNDSDRFELLVEGLVILDNREGSMAGAAIIHNAYPKEIIDECRDGGIHLDTRKKRHTTCIRGSDVRSTHA